MSGPVCRYWQQGNCRNGDSCRFEHPRSSSNRFGIFGTGGTSSSSGGRDDVLPYTLSKSTIQKDLTEERPPWILSAYGPGKDAPEQLFGGEMEHSFEELRLHHANGVAAGNPQGAITEMNGLYEEASRRIQSAVNNTDAALRFILDAENKHPNRIDVCKANTIAGGTNGTFAVGRQRSATASSPFGAPTQPANPFGAPSAPSGAGAFGRPSPLGQTSNAFGTSSFGQPSQPASGFGQPSQLGSSASPFGQQPQAQAAGSAFGQASTMGQKANPFGSPAFGQPSQPSTTTAPAFGQPSQAGGGGMSGFAKLAGAPSAFGQASALGQSSSPFGGGSAGSSPFSRIGGGQAAAASSPFGQPSQSNPSPFGAPSGSTASQASVFGQPSAAANPFGKPAAGAAANPFGQPAATNPSPFGQQKSDMSMGMGQSKSDISMMQSMMTVKSDVSMDAGAGAPNNPFGRPAASTTSAPNPFGAPSQPSQGASPFGAPSQATTAGGFGGSPAPPASVPASGAGNPYAPNATRQHPPASSYIQKDASGATRVFKGQPVAYQQDKEGKVVPAVRNPADGSMVRLWFPEGPPNYYKDTEAADAAYDEPTTAAYEAFVKTGGFEGGLMPMVPPKREWCMFDF